MPPSRKYVFTHEQTQFIASTALAVGLFIGGTLATIGFRWYVMGVVLAAIVAITSLWGME